jgi:2-polyprenyl-3-methyl-5-hydroxy-6-metoxy-1,4-benzoquinol methylase
MISSVQDHYDQFLAAHYTWMSGGHVLQGEKNLKVLSEFGLAAPRAGKALDLGCGSGYQSLALATLGFSVIAVDTSQPLLDELRSLAADKSITVVRGDMCSSETYKCYAPFDAIICMGDTLLHVPSREHVKHLFEDMFIHNRSGGKLLLSFRDLSIELKGIDRAIPVRLDKQIQMATFLEYTQSHVRVHDMLFTQQDGKCQMKTSAYQKLRLSGNEAAAMLAQTGFINVKKTVDQGLTIIAAEKPID